MESAQAPPAENCQFPCRCYFTSSLLLLPLICVEIKYLCFTHVEADILRIACVEASLKGDEIICHPQQFAILQSIFIDERPVARDVRVLLIEIREVRQRVQQHLEGHTRRGAIINDQPYRDDVAESVPLEQAEIRVGEVAALREPKVEEVVVGRDVEGVLHVEKDLLVGPVDEPVQLDRSALVQIRAVQFIIRNLWGLTNVH